MNIKKKKKKKKIILTDSLDITDECSSTGMLLHKDIQYKCRSDLEAQGLSTIWVQLNYPGHRPILVQAIYRQFCRLGHSGSHTITQQKKRWTRIIDKWEIANKGMGIITMGDCNLNRNSWNELPSEQDNY